jgi:hypothetical protein
MEVEPSLPRDLMPPAVESTHRDRRFDTSGNGTQALWGTAPPRLADSMHAAGLSFAATDDSGWPQYKLGRRATMRFETTPAVGDDS